jgi:hypothetical protein
MEQHPLTLHCFTCPLTMTFPCAPGIGVLWSPHGRVQGRQGHQLVAQLEGCLAHESSPQPRRTRKAPVAAADMVCDTLFVRPRLLVCEQLPVDHLPLAAQRCTSAAAVEHSLLPRAGGAHCSRDSPLGAPALWPASVWPCSLTANHPAA